MPSPPPSSLDANQVLQHSFEEASGRLRVDAAISPAGGATEVIIDHADDSIRLGDGTDLVTTTTVAGDVGLDVNIINTSIPVDLHLSGVPKYMAYNATYHTSKLQLILRHPVGVNHKMHLLMELFKA